MAASFRKGRMWSARGNTALVGVPWKYTNGIPTRSLIWALASHQISGIHWLKGLVPDALPRLAAGVLEDSTGSAWLGDCLEN